MGNFISISNVNEHTFPNDNSTYALGAYQNDAQTDFVALQPNSKYYINYIILHNASGEMITKTYPTPFYTKPLLGVSSFHMRVIYTDEFTLSVLVDNLQYTHEMYRNTLITCEVYARVWDTEFENDGFHPVLKTVKQDFDTNNEVSLQSSYLQQGEYVDIRITMKNPNDNTDIYYERQTPNRLFIPFVPLPTNTILYNSATPSSGIL